MSKEQRFQHPAHPDHGSKPNVRYSADLHSGRCLCLVCEDDLRYSGCKPSKSIECVAALGRSKKEAFDRAGAGEAADCFPKEAGGPPDR